MAEKRLRPRLKVHMPVQVVGRSVQQEKFREICQTQDASAYGICLRLLSQVERGSIVYLSMRMPRKLRLYDLASDIYQIYAQVQHVKLLSNGMREVGLAFLGKNPPPGFEVLQSAEYMTLPLKKAPGQTGENTVFDAKSPISSSVPYNLRTVTPSSTPAVTRFSVQTPVTPIPALRITPPSQPALPDTPPGRREFVNRETRFPIPIEVTVEFLDSSGGSSSTLVGLVSNISRSGACVMSTQEGKVGARLKLNMPSESFIVQAEVRSVSNPQPGLWNLHVKFLDKQWMGEIRGRWKTSKS